MRRLLKRRRKRPEQLDRGGEPSALTWLLALIGMALPWIAAGLGIAGVLHLGSGRAVGWTLLAAGAAAWVGDVAIDVVVARLTRNLSDQPDLNRRAAQLMGRRLLVAEAIAGGRGKVRVGDTLWPAEGPDTPVGESVTVTGSSGTTLLVTRLP